MRMMYKNLRIGGLAADLPYGKGKDDLIQNPISLERVEGVGGGQEARKWAGPM